MNTFNLSSKHFSYDKKTKTFVTEDSDLPLDFCDFISIGCHGLVMISEKTGAEKLFRFISEERNDGDITHWVYKSVGDEFTAIIFND